MALEWLWERQQERLGERMMLLGRDMQLAVDWRYLESLPRHVAQSCLISGCLEKTLVSSRDASSHHQEKRGCGICLSRVVLAGPCSRSSLICSGWKFCNQSQMLQNADSAFNPPMQGSEARRQCHTSRCSTPPQTMNDIDVEASAPFIVFLTYTQLLRHLQRQGHYQPIDFEHATNTILPSQQPRLQQLIIV